MAEKVHAMERKIRIPDEPGAHGYWQTVCGIRLAGETVSVTTSDDNTARLLENNGGGVLDEGNHPPDIEGSPAQTVTLPNPAILKVRAVDDGLPKPPRRTPNAATAVPANTAAGADPNNRRRRAEGLRIRWIQYRGPGQVTRAVYGTARG